MTTGRTETHVHTRREFAKLTLGGVAAAALRGAPLAAAIDSTINGIRIGAITYCFRSILALARATTWTPSSRPTSRRTSACASWGRCVSNRRLARPVGGRITVPVTPEYLANRQKLREWRMTVPMTRFREIRTKFVIEVELK